MSALRELRERVAMGEPFGDLPRPYALHTDLCWKAFSGSLDAAKTLHEALLPRWAVDDISQNGRLAGHPWGIRLACWNASDPNKNMSVSVGWGRLERDVSPAHAWLLAILDALIKEEDDHADDQ